MSDVRQHILDVLESAVGEKLSLEDLKESPIGDFGTPVSFRLAKELQKNPKVLAQEIAGKIKPSGLIEKVFAENGYINFTLNAGEVVKSAVFEKHKPTLKRGKIILEHTSVNPTGPVHVGRIRNTIIGDCLARILRYCGYEVETHYFVNDIGKQIAIIATGLSEGVEYDSELVTRYGRFMDRPDYQIFFTYVGANRLYESDSSFQDKVNSIIKDAESGDIVALDKIMSAARRCLEGQLNTFRALNVKFDVFDYESEGIRDGSVENVLDKIRGSRDYVKNELCEGVDLSRYGLGKRGGLSVLYRSDGTSVYLARDLAYHLKKINMGDRIINVLGEDHKLEFQELKAILTELLEVKKNIEAVHFSFVSFEGLKFSTRKGEIAAVDELLDEALNKAQEEVDKRNIGDESTASAVGVGAVKFHIVKTTPNKQITFRWEDALNFEGDSAPYIQYAYARSCRIIEKSGQDLDDVTDIDWAVADEDEKKLALKICEFNNVVETAASQLRPDLLASYLIELTGAYGRFYMRCPVLDSTVGVRNRRLLLVGKLKDTVKTGLDLLGIEAPQRM